MALLLQDRQDLKRRLLKAFRAGEQVALPETYQAGLKAVSGQDFPPTVEGLLEHLAYIENPSAVKPVVAPVVEPVAQPAVEPAVAPVEAFLTEPEDSGLEPIAEPEVVVEAPKPTDKKKSKK